MAIRSISKIVCLSGTQVAFETKVTNRAIGYLHSLVHFFSFLVNDNAFPCVNKIHKDQMELGWVTKIGTRLYRELLKADSRVANRRSEPLHGRASLLVRPPAAGQMTNSIARTMHVTPASRTVRSGPADSPLGAGGQSARGRRTVRSGPADSPPGIALIFI